MPKTEPQIARLEVAVDVLAEAVHKALLGVTQTMAEAQQKITAHRQNVDEAQAAYKRSHAAAQNAPDTKAFTVGDRIYRVNDGKPYGQIGLVLSVMPQNRTYGDGFITVSFPDAHAGAAAGYPVRSLRHAPTEDEMFDAWIRDQEIKARPGGG